MTEFGEIMQHGYIVPDVEAAALEWVEKVGAGPFYILRENQMDNYYYRGVRTPHKTRLAFGYWGEIQVEFVQPLDDEDTFYRDAVRTMPGQLNHMATVIESGLDELIAKHGLKDRIVHEGHMASGLKFVYLENYLPGGHHLEIIQPPKDGMLAFEGMKALAKTWNGERPIRDMMTLGEDLAALRGDGKLGDPGKRPSPRA